MGYSMHQLGQSFKIRNEHKADALRALHDLERKWAGERDVMKSSFGRNACIELTLEDQIAHYNWAMDCDCFGDVCELYFEGDRLGSEDAVFGAIAPYVEEGSSIEMIGEDDCIWMWRFENGECKTYYGKISYPDLKEPAEKNMADVVLDSIRQALEVFEKMELPVEERTCKLAYESAKALVDKYAS